MISSFPVLGTVILICILVGLALWDIIKMLKTKSISEEQEVPVTKKTYYNGEEENRGEDKK